MFLSLVVFPFGSFLFHVSLQIFPFDVPNGGFPWCLQARDVLVSVCKQLIADWRASKGDGAAAATPERKGGRAGSFLGLILAARDKQTGAPLSDLQVMDCSKLLTTKKGCENINCRILYLLYDFIHFSLTHCA